MLDSHIEAYEKKPIIHQFISTMCIERVVAARLVNVLNYIIWRKGAGKGDIWARRQLLLPSTFLGLMWKALSFVRYNWF